jgi:hypothetical protein
MISAASSVLDTMTYIAVCITVVAITLVLTGFLVAAYKWWVNRF